MNSTPGQPAGFTEPTKKKPIFGSEKNKRIAKRVAALALSGIIVGAAAGAAFVGVNYAAGNMNDTKVVSSTPTLQTSTTSSGSSSGTIDVSDVAAAAMPSIVSITNKSVQEVQNYFSMFGMGGGTQEEEIESAGSGIIVGQNDTELLIVTNNHVVEDADTLSVSFIDNSVCEAQVKGTDSDNDLAVVAVKLDDISDDTMSQIKAIQIGDSDNLKVGEQVVAIGNALGYGQSVTTGVVSAVDREIEDSSTPLIQTDAAINPGNSGGALINMSGELVGINSAKLASTEVEGMGYAIPVSVAQPIMENLMNRETREKVSEDQAASIGIEGVDVDSETAQTYGMPQGAYVANVNEGSAAEKAGLKSGMIITKFDGTSVDSMSDLKDQLSYYAAGETVTITVAVADNGEYKEQDLEITLDSADKLDSTDSQNLQNESFLRNFQGFQDGSLW
ncbi:MAG TPA: trypsin-like peptidase domain-containing protein [Candidatus Blautia intestinigallinarum]|nr:trypsin-like peptidase domain-containing protein [Candidatus Blautia intestinigallinarum]